MIFKAGDNKKYLGDVVIAVLVLTAPFLIYIHLFF